MVLIQLKSQYVSLIITVISGIAELCLFAAALSFNKYVECSALKRGRKISVRHHRARTRFLAVFAMVVFIVLEVFMSFYSFPDLTTETETRPCLSIERYDLIANDVTNASFDPIIISCFETDGDEFFQRVGNRSLPTEDAPDAQVRCSQSALYKFVGAGREFDQIGDNQTKVCDEGGFGCTFVELRGREFRFSQLLIEDEVPLIIDNEFEVEYLITFLLFDVDRSQESVLGRRAMNAFLNNVTDPMEQRRRILTSSQQSTCPFLVSTEPIATEVPPALIGAIAATWLLSLLALCSTLLFKRHIFYDMGDPLDWAMRTFRHPDEPYSDYPVVKSVYEHGERLMYVSSSSSTEHGLWRRARAGLRGRLGRRTPPVDDGSVEEQPQPA